MKKSRGAPKLLATLGAGEFFGEIELLRGGKSIACVRASEREPVDVLTYPREDFLRIIEESPITAEAIEKIVEERLARKAEGRKRKAEPKAEGRKQKAEGRKQKAEPKAESEKQKAEGRKQKDER
jgi:CRP-like cAMP-binding protein